MTFSHKAGLKYLTFNCLAEHGIRHGFFTRSGGVSSKPWHSLNTGALVGDTTENVLENRSRILRVMEADEYSLFDVWQVHSDRVVKAEAPRLQKKIQKADAIISATPGITLLMRFADCVPILLYDPKQCVIGIAHAGWKGTSLSIAGKTASAMAREFCSRTEDIIACIGPSIGQDHYEIGSNVVEAFSSFSTEQQSKIIKNRKGKTYLDLWLANEQILKDVGVDQIEIAGICTACNTSDWYSHRAEQGITGRFAAVIGL